MQQEVSLWWKTARLQQSTAPIKEQINHRYLQEKSFPEASPNEEETDGSLRSIAVDHLLWFLSALQAAHLRGEEAPAPPLEAPTPPLVLRRLQHPLSRLQHLLSS